MYIHSFYFFEFKIVDNDIALTLYFYKKISVINKLSQDTYVKRIQPLTIT